MNKLIITSIVSVISLNVCLAQNPYDPIGKKTEMLTLSKGKYIEYQAYDSLLKVGTVVLNIRQQKIHSFIEADTSRMPAEVTSRWLSLDPMAHKYPTMSPYVFAGNNPVMFVDKDGRDIYPSDAFKTSDFNSVFNDLMANNSVFGNAISLYNNSSKFNLKLDINDQNVKGDHSGYTTYTYNWQNIKGVRTVTSAEASIDFKTGTSGETNVLGRAVIMLHEYFHAYMGLKGVDSKGDVGHEKWDNYLGLMKNAVREYSKDNNLNLNETQIHELSIYNAGKDSKVVNNYIQSLADKNKTDFNLERANFDNRINDLVGPTVKTK